MASLNFATRFFAASCFFPYPALAIGGNNGLQLSQALALLGVPLLLVRPPGRPFGALLIVLTPLYLSMMINVMFGDVRFERAADRAHAGR